MRWPLSGRIPDAPRRIIDSRVRRRMAIAAAVGFVLLVAPEARAQELPEWTIRGASSPIEIDGRLEEPAWDEATIVPLAFEWYPGDNLVPPVATQCRVTFDPSTLFVGCHAEDARPGEIRAWLSEHDDTEGQDRIQVTIDPYGDGRRGFAFAVTPFGVRSDAAFDSRAGPDLSWDTLWDAAGRIGPAGWSVEIAIPFRSLRFPLREGAWGFVLERRYPRGADHRMGSMQLDRDDDCELCQAGRISGLAGVRPGRDVEIIPSLTATRTDRRTDPSTEDLEPAVEEIDAGITAEWGVRPGVTLAAAVNPDFSQVEADAARLEVNRRFTDQLPEKRPFFLEGNEMFETAGNLDLVFTRTVVDPVVGAKAIGEVGNTSTAAFVTLDRVTSLLLPGSQSSDEVSLDDDLATGVARWSSGLGGASVVGGLVTVRQGRGYSSRLAAADGILRLTRADRLSFHLARSATRYPTAIEVDDRSPVGSAAFLRWDHEDRRWGMEASWRYVGPGFRADAGFVPRVGLSGFEAQVRRVVWGGGRRWFDQIVAGADAQWLEGPNGFLLDRKIGVGVGFAGPWQSEVEIEVARRGERFGGQVFDRLTGGMEAQIRPNRAITLGLELQHGEQIDSENVRLATGTEITPSATLRIGRPVELDVSHRWERLSGEGGPAFTAHLAQTRLVYHFSVRAHLRAVVQWRRIARDPAQHPDQVDRVTTRLFDQLLFAWEVDPGTVLYLGYSDDRLGTDAFELGTTSRTAFIKLGYALRL